MEIKVPRFEKKEIEIRETYLDENGHHQERVKKVMVPTGKVLKDPPEQDPAEKSPKGQ